MMKNLLIIYPHWIPSNLVGVQRARLIANFLTGLGWHPIVLAVHPDYYEEPSVPELLKTVSNDVEVVWADAFNPSRKFRLIGDIALRGFRQLVHKAVMISKSRHIDFIWSPLPSFYTSLIVRRVHDLTGLPYGLDYMDPWVHEFPGARFCNRAWLAKKLASILEPIAVRKVKLLTGVTPQSYLPVIERNPHLKGIAAGYMPLGFDPDDYRIAPENKNLLWEGASEGVKPIIYAGAFLPMAHFYVKCLFSVVADMRKSGQWDENVRFYFVGTGNSPLKHISDYAEEYGLSDIVIERTDRISYLEVLNNLSSAFGVLAIGNIERHYTASKIFQSLLSGRRVLPIFHYESTVIDILRQADADRFLIEYHPDIAEDEFIEIVRTQIIRFLDVREPWNPNLMTLEKYSAAASARKLVDLIESALS